MISRLSIKLLALILALCLLVPVATPAFAAASPPGVPSSPAAKAGVAGSINLTWRAVTGATGYVVYRYLRGSSAAVRYAAVKTTAYTDKNIAANTFYKYKVRAYTASGSGNVYGLPSGFFFTPEIPITGMTTPAAGMKITKAWRVASQATGTDVKVVKLVSKTAITATYLTSAGKKYTIYPACYVAMITAKPQYFGSTCAEITDGKDESYVYAMAKKQGALVAVNGEAYSGHWTDAYSRYYSAGAVIKDRRIIQFIPAITGYGNKFTLVRTNGVWEKDAVIDSKAKAQQLIDSGVRFGVSKGGASLMYFDYKKLYVKDYSQQTLILSNDWMKALRNRTFAAQIDTGHYLMLTGELMPVQTAINVLNAYGAKNILWANGGNCSYMYLRGCGNVTGSAGNSIRNLDKINLLESEWKALHGYLGGGQLGGPCPAKDIFYFN